MRLDELIRKGRIKYQSEYLLSSSLKLELQDFLEELKAFRPIFHPHGSD